MKTIIFDMDDTLTDTNAEIYHLLFNVVRRNTDLGRELFCLQMDGKTTLALPPLLKTLSYHHVLIPGTFMLSCGTSPLLDDLDQFITLLSVLRTRGHRLAVGTHRGFHESGQVFTEAWLSHYGLRQYFDDIHVIDPALHPKKTEYFDALYDEYQIVDDNPLHDTVTVHPQDKRLIIYTGVGDYPGYANQRRVSTLGELYGAIDE